MIVHFLEIRRNDVPSDEFTRAYPMTDAARLSFLQDLGHLKVKVIQYQGHSMSNDFSFITNVSVIYVLHGWYDFD